MLNHERDTIDRPVDRVRAFVISLALTGSLALLLASIVPRVLFAAAMETLLYIAAFASAIAAGLRREPMWSRAELNTWDRSLVLLVAALAFGLFVDHAAVLAFLEEMAEVGAAKDVQAPRSDW